MNSTFRQRRSNGSRSSASIFDTAAAMRATSPHGTTVEPDSGGGGAWSFSFAVADSKNAAYSRASASCAESGRPLFSAADGQARRKPRFQWSPAGTRRKG
jgi:hypothetical protein